MTKILNNATVERKVPDWLAVKLASRVPIRLLRQVRDYHVNTPDQSLYDMLDHIGIEPMADVVSQGCFLYDIAAALDIPFPKFRTWLEMDNSRIDHIEKAEILSAEAYLSKGTAMVMSVDTHDTDGAKVAKVKADHLKWLAKVKDRDKYSDQVKHSHSGGQTIEYRINMSPAPPARNIIDV